MPNKETNKESIDTTQAPTPNRNGSNGSSILLPAPANQQMPMQLVPAPPAEPESTINAGTIFAALRRHWFMALAMGLTLGTLAAYGAWLVLPAPYLSFSEIRIRTTVPHVPLRTSNREPDFKTYKQTQMALVKSPVVLMAALRDEEVAKLDLIKEQEDPLEWLEEFLLVKNFGTEFFRISISGDDRKELPLIVNAVTDAYQTEIVDKERVALNRRITLYNDLLTSAQDELDRLRRSMQELAQSEATNKQQVDQRQQHLLDRRTIIYQRVAEFESEIMNLQILQELLQQGTENTKTTPIPKEVIDAHVADSEEYQKLKRQVQQSSDLLAWQQRELSENHPNIAKTKIRLQQTEGELDALRKKMEPIVRQRLIQGVSTNKPSSSAQNAYKLTILQERKTKFQDELNSIKVEQQDAGLSSLVIETLGKKIEQQELFTVALVNEVKRLQAEIPLRDEEPRISISRKAEVPNQREMKKKITGTALAGLGTFGMVLFGIIYFDIRLQRISSIQQISERLGLPVLGALPSMPKTATSRRNGSWSGRARYWHGVLTESIDSARTLLLREAERHSMKVIMITSATGTEGKTTVTCHLATSLARAGRSVLLIDGDLRRPFVHQAFEGSLEPGLSEILRGEAELDESLQPSGISRLQILAAGKANQKTLELLAQDRIGTLLEQWRSQFDFIIVDSAPILPVTDSLLIAQHVDGVLFSIRRDVSRATKVSSACQRLSMLGVPLLGAITIGLDEGLFSFRNPYGYGYGYASYRLASSE